ncbi:MAG: Nif3-like dinuclear metal center hexameric protein [Pseudomonadota bacterium]
MTKTITVRDIAAILEKLAPPGLAEPWDNIGLQVGGLARQVSIVMVALDPRPQVVSAACDAKAELLIVHHPLIFPMLKQINIDSYPGSIISMAIKCGLTIYAAHTNYDAAYPGLNDLLAQRLGIDCPKALKPASVCDSLSIGTEGAGRIGNLKKPVRLEEFVQQVNRSCRPDAVKVAGDPNMIVQKVCVCCGSGSGLIRDFFLSGADVYVSGDLRYHDAVRAEAEGKCLIDIGHFASEHMAVEALSSYIMKKVSEERCDVKVVAYKEEKDPFRYERTV